MEAIKHIQKIREYCDYVEDHIRNVEASWKTIQEACGLLHPFCDDFLWAAMDQMIREHDISKMSHEEFIPYQQQFYPVDGVKPPFDRPAFEAAWEHHKAHNPHHWENWTNRTESFPNENACHCVCMVVDWMAMGLHFGDTAEEFYNRKKNEINLPHWAVSFLGEMFGCLRSNTVDERTP